MNRNLNLTVQIWLAWIFTKALGVCGGGLAAIGLTTSHDTPQLMAGVTLTAAHLALSWWNTRRALQAAPTRPATTTGWPLQAACAAVGLTALGLTLTACSTTSATGSAASSGATAATPDLTIKAALPFIRTGASVATGAVLDFGVRPATTRTRLANEMYAAASAVYSLSGGTFPSVAQFQASIVAFGGTQADASYAQFTSAIGGLYAAYYPRLSTGNAKTAVDLLNAIAGGIEDATQAYVTTPAVNPALAQN